MQTANSTYWLLPPQPPSSRPCPGSFVTQVSGDAYVPLVLCLKTQLERVQSLCPLLVVVDDRSVRRLSQASLEDLVARLGDRNVLMLSSLVSRALATPGVAW
eukprot:4828941-Prymnesium_polylepis.1